MIDQGGLISYSWYTQYTLEEQVETGGELILKMWGICLVTRSQDGQTLRH